MNFKHIKFLIIQNVTDVLKAQYPEITEELAPSLREYVEDVFEKEYENVVLDIQLKTVRSQYLRLKRTRQQKFISDFQKYLEGKLTKRMMAIFDTLPKKEISEFIQIITEWKEDTNNTLIDFPYIEVLSLTQKKALLNKEIAWQVGLQLQAQLNSEPNIYEQVNPFIDNNLFSGGQINKITLSQEPVLLDDGELAFHVAKTSTKAKDTLPQNDYFVGAGFVQALNVHINQSIEANIDVSVNTQLVETAYKLDTQLLEDFSRLVPDLHFKDNEVFTEILRFRDYRFASTRTIEVPLKELTELSFPNTKLRKEHYDKTIERLLKLVYYKQIKKEKNGDFHVYGALSDLSVITRNGVRYAICTVSNMVMNAYQNNQVTSIYSAELPRLKGSIASKLVFFLQKERILAYQAALGTDVKIDYLRFLDTIRLVSRTKVQKVEEIKDALALIKEVGIIVKDFHISGNSFFISFYDLTPEELNVLSRVALEIL